MSTDLQEFKPDYDAIANAVRVLVEQSHGAMLLAGWWTDIRTGARIAPTKAVVGEKIALIHSELSEALEANRKTLMDDKLPHRPGLDVELADAILRDTDLIGVLGLTEQSVQAIQAIMFLPRPAVALAMVLRSIAEMATEYDLDLPGATAEKARYNANRLDHKIETRRLEGGKAY
jgi:hypothetical protein